MPDYVTIHGVTNLVKIGENGGVSYYFRINNTTMSVLVAHTCPQDSTEADKGSYEVMEGSDYSFTEKVGISVEAGVKLPFVGEGKVTVSGEISATQAFSKQTTTRVEFSVSPGTTYILYEAILDVSYYQCMTIKMPMMPGMKPIVTLSKMKDAHIYTGVTKGVVTREPITQAFLR
jgi:hypothetical protein